MITREILILSMLCGLLLVNAASAQNTGGTPNTGTGTPTQTPTQPTNNTQNQGGTANLPTDAFQLGDMLSFGQEFTRDSVYQNDRIQPFVGGSVENIVHPRSQIDPAGSTLGSSGSSSGRSGFTMNSASRNAQGGRANSAFGATGTTGTSSTVSRRGVRSALNYGPMMTASPSSVSGTFKSRLTRLPALRSSGSIEMQVDNRVATLSGVVGSEEQRERIERQAELEPGVDRVVNRLEVKQ